MPVRRDPRGDRGRRSLGPARRVIASISVSGFGTWAYNVGIAVYVYDRTQSAGWVAAVTVGRYLPALVLSWLARSLADRFPRRALVVSSDLGCTAIMLIVALLAGMSAPIWLLLVFAAASSTLARVQAAALLSLAADVVVESNLARASRFAGAAEASATAAGSAAASLVLLHFPAWSLFVVNALTFVVSAALIANLRSPGGHRVVNVRVESTPQARVFWPLQATRALASLLYGVDIVLLAVIADAQLRSGTAGYGWLLAATGLGGLLAVLPRRRHGTHWGAAALATSGLLIYALPLGSYVLDPGVAGSIVTQVVRGAGSVLMTASVLSALQRTVPSAFAGRVFATTQALVLAGTCVGALVTPLLLAVAGLHRTVLIVACVASATQLGLLPALLRFDRREASLLATLDPRLVTLRNLDLLREASRATLYMIADSITVLRTDAATEVIREGDVADALYVLVSGAADVTRMSHGDPVVINRLAAPDYFGEIGLLRAIPRTATVTTTEPSMLWQIPADVLLAALSEAGVSGALSDTVDVRFGAPLPGSQGHVGVPSAR